VDNLENVEMNDRQRFKAARNVALQEFFFHHDYCRNPRSCWNWPKYKSAKGYGVIIYDGFKFSVHRLSFEHYKGLVPKGLVIMHDCDNPACFNPAHLFLGTHAENMQDMVRKGRHRHAPDPSVPAVGEEPHLLKRIQKERENISWFGRSA
jgi:hypothetical protein